jgi:ABC-2 type transport system permease protein
VPFLLVGLLITRPASPAAVILSLLPLTSAVAMPMRLFMSAVPFSSWLLGLALQAVAVAAAAWLVARLFRITLLLAGEEVSWRVWAGRPARA